MEIYDNSFSDRNVYGHIADLFARFEPKAGSYFLDFGCGFGRLAEVVEARYRVKYVGFDINEPGLESLRARGFAAHYADLGDAEAAFELVRRVLPEGAAIAALCTIDTLEHLPDPLAALRLYARIGRSHSVPLLVSVPNVAHTDIGAKLTVGRFDYTEAGLLDHTHMQYFTSDRFTALMRDGGWHEVHRYDVSLLRSDQHFPAQLPVLARKAPLAELLAGIREQVDDYGYVNQFVRAYLPGPETTNAHVPYVAVREREDSRFLSVVIRTVGRRIETLRESLLCLTAQTCQDFEIIIAGHNLDVQRQIAVEQLIAELHEDVRVRARLIIVDGGGRSAPLNAGFLSAEGRYVVAFDDDDLVFGNWVETFRSLEEANPGQLLRATAAAQDWDRIRRADGVASRAISGMRMIYPDKFELIAHLVENRTPLHSIAFPRVLFSDLGYRFDPDLSTAEDWDLIVRVAPLSGVASSKAVTALYRLWKCGDNSASAHDQFEWQSNYFKTLKKINATPLLLPAGSVVRLRKMYLALERLQGHVEVDVDSAVVVNPHIEDGERIEQLRERYHELINSFSWQMTGPLRQIRRTLRRQPRPRMPKIWTMNEQDLEFHIRQILNSSSWRWTRVLRSLRRR
ncbi:glycosyl transferase family A [Stenotrophomonas maltophilia]|uniref:methyltransferase domain-containing protein n=1 Tax=Stenotrophomonas maltophilia TaxID=40324 RepID=UPI000D4D4AC3|nr:methyltransferase domain-containing protein [Stenotrophomonas maltophilia]PSD17178.1 glycosyl transferase family A [Stenotrophomonas maltophilia]PSD31861.1 glycosyl transferase family A [Stenotrophomonas maltophilia]